MMRNINRVAFYGNTANNYTGVVAALRAHSDVEAFLLIDENTSIYTDPASEYQAASSDFSEQWVIRDKWLNSVMIRKSRIISWLRANNIDVLVVSDMGARVLPFVEIPTIFAPVGFDVISFPQPYLSRVAFHQAGDVIKKIFLGEWCSAIYRAGLIRLGRLQLRGLQHADRILAVDIQLFRTSLDKHLKRKRRLPDITYTRSWLPMDGSLFKPRSPEELSDPRIRAIRSAYDFLVFHPSRFLIREEGVPMPKGNDVLLRGFALFLASLPDELKKGCALVLIERDEAIACQVDEVRALIVQLNLEENIQWISTAGNQGLRRFEMAEIYAASDVVADQFAGAGFGAVTLEALSSGKPLLLNFDPNKEERLYGARFPALLTTSDQDVEKWLTDLYWGREFRADIGEESRRWAQRFHDWQPVADFWVTILGTQGPVNDET